MEGKIVVYTACNNGSSSVISKDGELYMLEKMPFTLIVQVS